MKTIHICLIFLLFGLIFACEHEADPTPPDDPNLSTDSLLFQPDFYYPDSTNWKRIDPKLLGWNTDSLQSVINFVGTKNTTAFLMLYKGAIVSENYWNEWDSLTVDGIASAGKSMTAVLAGIAVADGQLDLYQPSATYLGRGWSSLTEAQEDSIKVIHHLSMTTGLDESEDNCRKPECMLYKQPAGTRWSYHNAPYFLIQHILEQATNEDINTYTKSRLADPIGIKNFRWDDYQMFMSARDMSRFGLLILSGGKWKQQQVLPNHPYFENMLRPSQTSNDAYGLLWWLNGKNNYMIPNSDQVFPGSLFAAAPDDMVAAMGRGDKKIYIVPSMSLVIVRHGEETGNPEFGPESFDNQLWLRLQHVIPKRRPASGRTTGFVP